MACAYEVAEIFPDRQWCVPAFAALGAAPRRIKRERGFFALNFAAILVMLLTFCALAIELGQVYNRKVELHGAAKAVALAAARELNGTLGGVNAAITKGEAVARGFKYQYGAAMPWSESAITFSTAPSGATWVDASTAKLAPAGRYYVKVDAALFGAGVGIVNTPFMSVLPNSFASVTVTDRAIAGRTSINITPLAICAMSTTPRGSRPNDGVLVPELVEYGFRRGVGYDLMKLNPNGTGAANFIVDPVFQPGATGASSHTSASVVAPFVCAGNLWMPRVTGGQIRVSKDFPSSQLYTQLNSRFDKFQNTPCSPNGAPPDFNVKPYDIADTASVGWMNPLPGVQAAGTTTVNGKLETVLDLNPTPAGLSGSYGPLWSYAKAAKYSPTVPATGETFFTAADWPHLYRGGPTDAAATPPYLATAGAYYGRPAALNLAISKEDRRVLNVPLLACPVAGSDVPATVLAVGRFFMTVPATAISINAEFSGIASEESLTGPVELY